MTSLITTETFLLYMCTYNYKFINCKNECIFYYDIMQYMENGPLQACKAKANMFNYLHFSFFKSHDNIIISRMLT